MWVCYLFLSSGTTMKHVRACVIFQWKDQAELFTANNPEWSDPVYRAGAKFI